MLKRDVIIQEAVKRSRLVNGKPICGYIMGATGWICTQARLDAQAKQYPLYAESIYKYGPQWFGKNCYDCAQLVRTVAKLAGYNMVSGASSQYSKTAWDERGPIATLPQKSGGLFLYKQSGKVMSHTAVCIGDGTEVEALGHQSGVVRRSMIGRTFTHWARLPGLDQEYTGSEGGNSGGGAYMIATVDTSPAHGGTNGSLNVREGPSTSKPIVTRLLPGTKITVIERGEDWSQLPNGYVMTKYLSFPGDTPGSATTTRPTLRFGDTGKYVQEAQQRLLVHGRSVTPDGIFGDRTLIAVKQFQGLNALIVDGVIGFRTWTELLEEHEENPPEETLYRIIIENLTAIQVSGILLTHPNARKEIM